MNFVGWFGLGAVLHIGTDYLQGATSIGLLWNFMIINVTFIIVELITIILRFGFNISSKENLIKIKKKLGLKKIIHFHHFFMGLILSIIGFILHNSLVFSIGIGIAIAGLLHHFAVLWYFKGDPDFHLTH